VGGASTKFDAAGGISQFSASSAQNKISFSAKVDNPLKTMNDPGKNLETGSVISEATKSIG